MNTVAQTAQIPYDIDHEGDAAKVIVAILMSRGILARSEYMGYGTPILVPVGDKVEYAFQGWGQEDDHWYGGRHVPDDLERWGPDEQEDSSIELTHVKGERDLMKIAIAIHEGIVERIARGTD